MPGALMPGTFMGQRSAGLVEGSAVIPAAGSNHVQPTKLFIGGISRRTTTKQLRDHFSKKSGRVLDCVAMRTPDGRPRGFGYVTLDSPAAAERFLLEPQMIDDRIVDMKSAVPEVNTPKAFGSQSQQGMAAFGMDASMMMSMQGIYSQPGMFCPWPEPSGFYYDDGFGGMGMQDMGVADSVPDCVNVLTGSLLAPPSGVENQAPSASGKENKTQKAPLADVTNSLGNSSQIFCAKRPAPTPLSSVVEPGYIKPQKMLSASAPCFIYEDPKEREERAASVASTEPPSPAGEDDLSPHAPSLATPVALHGEVEGTPSEEVAEGLPSLGSAQHASGECRRCNFFAKGRCKNGADCVFCHLPHDRRKMSRQEKQDQEAETATPQHCGPLLSPVAAGAPPGLFLEANASEPPAETFSAPQSVATASSKAALPPGLRPPGLPSPHVLAASAQQAHFCQAQALLGSLMPWETAASGMLSTNPLSSAGNASPFFLATSPTVAQTASAPAGLQKTAVKETRTVGTQTDDDFTCPHCEECSESSKSPLSQGCECGSPTNVSGKRSRRRRIRPAAAIATEDDKNE